jgi:hypothetical protein
MSVGMTSGGSCRSTSITATQSPRVLDAGRNRDLMSEVPGELQQPDARVAGRDVLQLRVGVVVAASSTNSQLVIEVGNRASTCDARS